MCFVTGLISLAGGVLYGFVVLWPQEEKAAKWLFGGVILLTLASSGVSVGFSYIGRNFWTALSSKNEAEFYSTMKQFFAALAVGVPINVM